MNFFLAVIVAIWFSFRPNGHPFRRARGALWLWWRLLVGEPVRKDVYLLRMEACRKCPIFYPRLGTCGSPLSDNPDLGCWCAMEKKARLKEADCWLVENTTNSGWGWPRALYVN